jgi:hypothetical protein
MAAQTYGEVWRKVALRVPAAPVSLVQGWVQEAYDKLAGKGHWAWLRQEAVLTTLASRTITATFTPASTQVTSAGAFLSTDVGRQIRVPNQTIYTIDTFTNVNTVDLTQAYAETGGALSATIQDIYLAMPADFRSIYDVTDMSIQRPIAWWVSRDRLDLFDPGRISSDSRLRILASYQLSGVTSLAGRVLYEAWPFPTAAGSYQLRYFKRMDTLDDEEAFRGVLATKTGALIEGALAQAALWPGTTEQKNPYFSLALSDRHTRRFDEERQDLGIMDDDQYLMMLEQIDLSKFGLAALSADTSLLRQSDATLADYY